jgi:CheY-like chemotaxis protein
MSEETLEHLFEPFFTTKPTGEGTGLGLATVHAFAKDSEGDVRVKSRVGAGTTFTLLFPAVVAAESGRPASERPLPKLAKAGAKVLVVEDREDVRVAMVKTLEEAGFSVTSASDGDAALTVLSKQQDFSVLCIDGVMPGATTGQVIERAERVAPLMRVLLCSGYLPEDLLRRDIAMGRYAFLQKPFSGRELLTAVHGLFETPTPDSPPAS